jgi:uncharacterized protein (DUF1697 family)
VLRETHRMARVVAMLRGVNIGKRRLPMAVLRDGLVVAGATDVATYVQSGNVVLTPPRAAGGRTRVWLEETIGAIAGFEVPVVVRTAAELAAVVERNPYPGAGGTRLHVLFCDPAPPEDLLGEIDHDPAASEAATLVGADLYLHLPHGIGRARLPTLLERPLRRAGVTVTARNWNTVERLHDMLEEAR